MESKTIFQHKPEAEAVAEVVRKHVEPRTIDIGGTRAILALPHGIEAKSLKPLLDEYRTEPERRKGTAALADLESFIAHVKRFADEDSAIFADRNPAAPALVGVLDYHRRTAQGAPRFGTHRARYAFPLSDPWQAWTGADGKTMSQQDFAAWLEEHLADVADPSLAGDDARAFATLFDVTFAGPAKLLALSKGLTVHVGARVQQHVNLSTGEAQIAYHEEHQDGKAQPLKVPGAFLLAIAPFKRGAAYKVPARLRYRVSQGNISWHYSLHRADDVFDHAIDEACATAAKETGLPLFAGTPEQ